MRRIRIRLRSPTVRDEDNTMLQKIASLVSCTLLLATVSVSASTGPPTVRIDDATVVGFTEGTSTSFLGIPFAQPPVGKLRLQLPQPIARHTGVINATAFGNQCIQQDLSTPTVPSSSNLSPEILGSLAQGSGGDPVPQSEDCLNINVIVPAGTRPGDGLPVAAWIYGGGFAAGSNTNEPGAVIVNRSIELGQPVIFVSMNYRVNAFGFLGGSEIQKAGLGNLGLHDQREALRWMQKHISAFGGDPTKVTIWGQSAGSRSVLFQMITNDGDNEGLFRAGWMESGSALPGGSFSLLQPTFDFMVSETGCASAPDALECLREIPVESFTAAMDQTPSFLSIRALNTPWIPHTDGVFFKDNVRERVLDGVISDVPFVASDCEDEGTVFSLSSLNITTTEEVGEYMRSNYFPGASNATIARLLELYPEDPAAGSPFGTGDQFALTPEFKRIAAFQGDLVFQAPRRFLLNLRAGKQVVRSFFNERNKTPGLGASHGSELPNVFGGGDLTDFLVRFVNTLDPNGGPQIHWPEYSSESPQLLTLVEGTPNLTLMPDTFRKEQLEFLAQLVLTEPF